MVFFFSGLVLLFSGFFCIYIFGFFGLSIGVCLLYEKYFVGGDVVYVLLVFLSSVMNFGSIFLMMNYEIGKNDLIFWDNFFLVFFIFLFVFIWMMMIIMFM